MSRGRLSFHWPFAPQEKDAAVPKAAAGTDDPTQPPDKGEPEQELNIAVGFPGK
jgi:hypothetical protein